MVLNEKDIAGLAHLARIELDQNQYTHVKAELNSILHLFKKIQKADITSIEEEPLSKTILDGITPACNLREDLVNVPKIELGKTHNRLGTVSTNDWLFLVPQVIEKF